MILNIRQSFKIEYILLIIVLNAMLNFFYEEMLVNIGLENHSLNKISINEFFKDFKKEMNLQHVAALNLILTNCSRREQAFSISLYTLLVHYNEIIARTYPLK